MSNLPGISDRVQSVIVIVATATLTLGTYLSLQTQDPRYVILGGVLTAVALGVKEALGVKPTVAK